MNRHQVTAARYRSKCDACQHSKEACKHSKRFNRLMKRPVTGNPRFLEQPQQHNATGNANEHDEEEGIAHSEWLQSTSVFWTRWGSRMASELTSLTLDQFEDERQARLQSARAAREDTIYSARSGRRPKYGQFAEEADSSDTDLSMLSCSDIDEIPVSTKKTTVRVKRRSKLFVRQRSGTISSGTEGDLGVTGQTNNTADISTGENSSILPATSVAQMQSNASLSPSLQNSTYGSKTPVIKKVTLNDEERELLRLTLRASATATTTRERSASIENIRELPIQASATNGLTSVSRSPAGRRSKNSSRLQQNPAQKTLKASGPVIVFLKTRRRSLDSRTGKEKLNKPVNLRTRSSDYRSRTPASSVWATPAMRTLDQSLADDTSINKIIRHGQSFLRQHPASASLERSSDRLPARENYTKIATYPKHLHLSLPLRDVIEEELDMIIANKRPIAVNTQLLEELNTTNVPLGRSYRNHVLFNWMNTLEPHSQNKLPYSAKF